MTYTEKIKWQMLNQEELCNTEGGFLPLLLAGIALFAACSSQRSDQGGSNNSQINVMYNGSYPDTTIIAHDGRRDTIINR